MESQNDPAKPSLQYRYYMVRVQTPSDAAPAIDAQDLAGIVERLGSGEKREFSNAVELLRLVTAWSEANPNMDDRTSTGND